MPRNKPSIARESVFEDSVFRFGDQKQHPSQEQEAESQQPSEPAEPELAKATYYLLPDQPDAIAEWQLAIKRQTGKRVQKSELVQYALKLLADQFARKSAKEIYTEMQR